MFISRAGFGEGSKKKEKISEEEKRRQIDGKHVALYIMPMAEIEWHEREKSVFEYDRWRHTIFIPLQEEE